MTPNSPNSEEWLVRTEKNFLSGPFPKEKVIQMIQQGQLGPQDEVCRGSHYWIYLHEREEVLNQLGVEMPRRPVEDDEEITETQTERLMVLPSSHGGSSAGSHERTPVAAMGAAPTSAGAVERFGIAPEPQSEPQEEQSSEESNADGEDLLELEVSEAEIGENTAILTNRALRQFGVRPEPTAVAEAPAKPLVVGEECAKAAAPVPATPTREALAQPVVEEPVSPEAPRKKNWIWIALLVLALVAAAVVFVSQQSN